MKGLLIATTLRMKMRTMAAGSNTLESFENFPVRFKRHSECDDDVEASQSKSDEMSFGSLISSLRKALSSKSEEKEENKSDSGSVFGKDSDSKVLSGFLKIFSMDSSTTEVSDGSFTNNNNNRADGKISGKLSRTNSSVEQLDSSISHCNGDTVTLLLRDSIQPEPITHSTLNISTGHIVLAYMEDHMIKRNRLSDEWDALSSYESEQNQTTVASSPMNKRKNRFADVIPYDYNRIVLNQDVNINGSDYINASTIRDHDPKCSDYVVTQGPLPHTVADFWQMIWEIGSVVIVNLTLNTEHEVAKCHQYWPENGSDIYHKFEVHLVSQHILSDEYVVRSLFLKNLTNAETRTVTQYHYLAWPDHSLPPSTESLLNFRRKVNKSYRGHSRPLVVHCSDGSGRTGTYCLIDMVINRLGNGAKELDIAATLEHFRDQRMKMVETKEQFEFVLLSVADDVCSSLKAFRSK